MENYSSQFTHQIKMGLCVPGKKVGFYRLSSPGDTKGKSNVLSIFLDLYSGLAGCMSTIKRSKQQTESAISQT